MTVAMMLAERNLLGSVDLVASDINERGAAARTARDVRAEGDAAAAEGVLGRWLRPTANGCTVDPALTAAVEWRRVNLVDPQAIRALGTFDVILCRNVLIYFSDETTRTLAANLSESLAPAGCLLLGVSESLLRFGTALAAKSAAACSSTGERA